MSMMLNTYSAGFLKAVTEQKNKYGCYVFGKLGVPDPFCFRFLLHDKTMCVVGGREGETK